MNPFLPILSTSLLALATAVPPAHETPSWTQPTRPFRIYGNTWYVGTQGLSAILITSPQGHVLIDGTLPQNAARVEANIRALGFDLRDVRVILNSHTHADHAGAIARLAHDTGAQVWARVPAAKALRAGGFDPDDPQYGETSRYPAPAAITLVSDEGVVHLGPLAFTAHATPGHTPGGTSWTWRSCEGARCLNLAYVDSLTAIGRKGFRYSDQPELVRAFRATLDRVAHLPCDILLTPHPDASNLMPRIAQRDHGNARSLVDPHACQAYAEEARRHLDARLAEEQKDPR